MLETFGRKEFEDKGHVRDGLILKKTQESGMSGLRTGTKERFEPAASLTLKPQKK
ncbi:MAG: hypothetical protein U5L00_07360 [Desulfovermiculus sp.]|nr:hypothetical protein [Desulfovermiculus sp.]